MGGQRSTVASHPERAQIEARIRKGDPATHIARDHGLSRQAISRAKSKLLARPAGQGDGDRVAMMRQVRVLYNSTIDLMTKAKNANAPRSFLAATSEARKVLGLMSKILGLLNESPSPTVAVAVQIDLSALRLVIVDSLKPFPEAGAAVAAALIEYDAREAEGGE